MLILLFMAGMALMLMIMIIGMRVDMAVFLLMLRFVVMLVLVAVRMNVFVLMVMSVLVAVCMTVPVLMFVTVLVLMMMIVPMVMTVVMIMIMVMMLHRFQPELTHVAIHPHLPLQRFLCALPHNLAQHRVEPEVFGKHELAVRIRLRERGRQLLQPLDQYAREQKSTAAARCVSRPA